MEETDVPYSKRILIGALVGGVVWNAWSMW